MLALLSIIILVIRNIIRAQLPRALTSVPADDIYTVDNMLATANIELIHCAASLFAGQANSASSTNADPPLSRDEMMVVSTNTSYADADDHAKPLEANGDVQAEEATNPTNTAGTTKVNTPPAEVTGTSTQSEVDDQPNEYSSCGEDPVSSSQLVATTADSHATAGTAASPQSTASTQSTVAAEPQDHLSGYRGNADERSGSDDEATKNVSAPNNTSQLQLKVFARHLFFANTFFVTKISF